MLVRSEHTMNTPCKGIVIKLSFPLEIETESNAEPSGVHPLSILCSLLDMTE